jgi:hypothetical protein
MRKNAGEVVESGLAFLGTLVLQDDLQTNRTIFGTSLFLFFLSFFLSSFIPSFLSFFLPSFSSLSFFLCSSSSSFFWLY